MAPKRVEVIRATPLSSRAAWELLADRVSALEAGMHRVTTEQRVTKNVMHECHARYTEEWRLHVKVHDGIDALLHSSQMNIYRALQGCIERMPPQAQDVLFNRSAR